MKVGGCLQAHKLVVCSFALLSSSLYKHLYFKQYVESDLPQIVIASVLVWSKEPKLLQVPFRVWPYMVHLRQH